VHHSPLGVLVNRLPQFSALKSMLWLDWPRENALHPELGCNRWFHATSNYCLDFHGDPVQSNLHVFSDGNHHMALEQTLESLRAACGHSSIFYCTTPPKVYLDWLQSGSIEIGNLRLSVAPDIIVGPVEIMESLLSSQKVCKIEVFARSVGNSFLVLKDNPQNICTVGDLFNNDVRLFLSNPVTESASHEVYRHTLEGFASEEGLAADSIERLLKCHDKVYFGERIHHREAPQALVNGDADVAVIYDHLALRYTRIFPEIFHRIQLPVCEYNIVTRYAVGVVDENCHVACHAFEHFLGDETASIYQYHGLQSI